MSVSGSHISNVYKCEQSYAHSLTLFHFEVASFHSTPALRDHLMFCNALLSVSTLLGLLAPSVYALGSTCSTPLTKGNAGPNDPFWMENIVHQGMHGDTSHILTN